MRKKFLSIVLCVCMMLTMVPFAFAADTSSEAENNPVEVWTGFSGTKVASYTTVKEASEHLGDNKWIVIGSNYTLTENFTIPEGVFLDIAAGATLTVANGVTLTVAANAKRLGVRDNAILINNGTIMVCGTDYSNGYVMVQNGGTLDATTLSVPEGRFLDKNGSNYYSATAQYKITYSDNTTKLASSLSDLSGAKSILLLDNVSDFARNFSSTDKLDKNFTLDLNGYTLTGKSDASTYVMSVAVPMTIKNGTIRYASSNASSGAIITTADVTIASDAVIDGGNGYGIWTDGYGHTLTVNGTIASNGAYTITSNGSMNGNLIADCNIIVNDGAKIDAPKGIGIYHPELGTVTINGGSISGNTGVEMCAGNLVVNGGSITSTGPNVDATGSQNAILDGAAVSIINRNYPGGTPTATITGGGFTATGKDALAVKAYDYTQDKVTGWTDVNKYVSITGGYFTKDSINSLCAPGFMALKNTDSNATSYAYKVGKIQENAENKIEETVVPGTTATDVSKIKEGDREAATSIASSVKPSDKGLSTDKAIVSAEDKQSAITELVKKNQITVDNDGKVDNTKTVTIIKQPYLDVAVISMGSTSIVMNITPKYNLLAVATTGDTAPSVDNGVIIASARDMTVTTPTEVTLTLPSGFASDSKKVYIKHEASNGKVYYYTATVGADNKITFTTKNGFSPFTISTTSEAVAEVDGIGYATFQDAVDAVSNNGTITALANIDSTVSGNKTFTVEPNGKTVNLTAASGYSLSKNGNTYTVSTRSHSSSGSTTYAVNVNAATNGAVAADKKTAAKGTTVTVTATPSAGYVVDSVKVVDKDGKDVAVSEKDGKYVFTMPASAVTVTASFKAETPAPSGLPFVDVKSGDWFYAAVKYAYENGLMNGTGETVFAPNGTMNRAMIVTVLYRLEKSPAVTTPAQFKDVPAGQWYSDAVAWAAANNIVNGYDETTFGPLNAVTREQMAAILYRYEQYKGMDTVTLEENLARFPDKDKVSAYAVPAMQWAVGQKVINGNADGTLDPTGTATRAQVAQIFSNLLNK